MLRKYSFLITNKDAGFLFLSNSLNMFGSWIRIAAYMVFFHNFEALDLFAILLISKQVIELFCQPIAGWLADHTCKKRLKMITQGSCSVIALVIAGLMLLPQPPLIAIVTLSSFATLFAVIFSSAAMSVTPIYVKDANLPLFNSLMGSVSTFSLTLGPALGGLIMLVGGPAVVLMIDALLFGVSLGFVLRLTKPKQPEGNSTESLHVLRPQLSQLVQGFTYIFKSRSIMALVFFGMASNAGVAATWILNPHLNQTFGFPDEWVSYTMSIVGVGSFLGMTLGGWVPERHYSKTCVLATLAFIFSLSLWGLQTASVMWFWVPPFFMGLFACIHEASYWTLLQKHTPEHLFGRVFSAVDSLAVIGMIVGSFLTETLVKQGEISFGRWATVLLMLTLWTCGCFFTALRVKAGNRKLTCEGLHA